MRALSLGAGVQSSTLALMAEHGEIELADFAVFADTGWEPRAVYQWLSRLEKELTYPVIHVSAGDIRAILIARSNQGFSPVPYFTAGGGMGRRQCTHEYKIAPITKELRSRRKEGEIVQLMIGISLDEVRRMKPSRTKWIEHTWPLIDLGMSRHDCVAWLAEHGYPAPSRSACIGCPYHGDAYWRVLKERSPVEWEDAVYIDHMIRLGPGMRRKQYMHRSRIPLDEVDLRSEEQMGQLDLFGNECEGVCGV